MKPSTAPASQNLVKVKRAAGLVMRGVSEKEGLLSQRLGLKPLISLLILNLFSQLEGPFSLWRPSRVRFKRFSCRSHRKWCRNLTLDFPSMPTWFLVKDKQREYLPPPLSSLPALGKHKLAGNSPCLPNWIFFKY